MKVCIVENNLAGLLTAVYHYYYIDNNIDIISADKNSVTMLDERVDVSANVDIAKRVREGIIKKVGRSGYHNIYCGYLNFDKGKEQKIFEYLKLLFVYGKKVNSMFAEKAVMDFFDMVKKVKHEAHRMQGFIRFREMDNGIYYSYFSSDNDIMELIIPHFKTRFNDEKFVLHDVKRKKMAYYDKNKVTTLVAPEKLCVNISDKEEMFEQLWREYFENVSIDDRRNTRLQTQYAPKKYRWFMNEF